MKLDYKIIWVEDKIDTEPFKELVFEIGQHLENEFFNVTIDTAEDYDDFVEIYEKQDTFDLIITDLNLNESHGSQVIDFIRDEKHNFTEIFFYSANKELSSAQLINSSRITFYQLEDQRYHKELGNNIKNLINLTISKFQNIISMRGMIMQETSDIDLKLQEFLKAIISQSGEAQQGIIDTLKKKKIKSNSDFIKRKIVNNQDIDDLLLSIGADHRVRGVLRNIDESKFKTILTDYKKEIIDVRNQFAHAILDTETNTFKTKNGIVFNQDLCKEIRRNINKHITNIDTLLEI